MMFSLRSRLFALSSTLRGSAGIPLLFLCACSVGIDDRPVPPEPIPGVAFEQVPEAGAYGAPAASAAPAMRAAASRGGETLVWQTGAQPLVTGRGSLDAPEADVSDAGTVDESASAEEEAASGEGEPAEAPDAGESAAEQVGTAEPAGERTFRLAPFVGIDAEAAAPLRQAVQAEAERRGIRLGGGERQLILKGYLSSMEDGGAKVLTYVWDVYDGSGNRLTRINGQETLPGGAETDPLHVDPGTARKVAARAIAELARWQSAGGTG